MTDVRLDAPDPIEALARLRPQITAVAARHGFTFEAAGADWAHWTKSDDDDRVVLRAYVMHGEPCGLSLTVTGGAVAPQLERDLGEID